MAEVKVVAPIGRPGAGAGQIVANTLERMAITFCDQAENHVGMQKLGSLATRGFTLDDLLRAKIALETRGVTCELVALHDYLLPGVSADQAWLLIGRNAVRTITDVGHLWSEMRALDWDKKFLNKGRVCNKDARHNLCFADTAQEPDYAKGKGRVIDFKTTPELAKVRRGLELILGQAGANLLAEGNHYYDIRKCYIGWHGDAERRKVAAICLGATMPLAYHWHYQTSPVGKMFKTLLNDGDLYIMSEKAAGCDWHRKIIYTLRHAAGEVGIANLKPLALANGAPSFNSEPVAVPAVIETKNSLRIVTWAVDNDENDQSKKSTIEMLSKGVEIVCLQDLRCNQAGLEAMRINFFPYTWACLGERGLLISAKFQPRQVWYGFYEMPGSGRIITMEFDTFLLASAFFEKEYNVAFQRHLEVLRQKRKPLIVIYNGHHLVEGVKVERIEVEMPNCFELLIQ